MEYTEDIVLCEEQVMEQHHLIIKFSHGRRLLRGRRNRKWWDEEPFFTPQEIALAAFWVFRYERLAATVALAPIQASVRGA